MVGIGGLLGLLYVFSQQLHFNILLTLVLVAIVAGALGSARLAISNHVPAQIYAGFILGFSVEWIFLKGLEFYG